MKKTILYFVLFIIFIIGKWSVFAEEGVLFDKLFDCKITNENQYLEEKIKSKKDVSYNIVDIVDNNFSRIKLNLSKYSISKRIELYNWAVEKINNLISSTNSQKNKKVLIYFRDLIKKEVDNLNNERWILVDLFGDNTNKICNEWYIFNNWDCIPKTQDSNNVNKRICYVSNWYWNQFYYTNYWSKCYVVSCNNGYYLDYNNNCIKDYNYNNYNYYNWNYYNCWVNEHYEDNRCISNYKYCNLDNWYWKQTWYWTYWWSCVAESCNSWFYLSNGSCIKTYYNCWVNEHYEDNRCISNYKYCNLDNWYWKQTWYWTYWWSCVAESCNSWFYLSNGSCIKTYYNCWVNEHYENNNCISNYKYCSISNWYWKQTWYWTYWWSCYVEACNSWYYIMNGNCYRN